MLQAEKHLVVSVWLSKSSSLSGVPQRPSKELGMSLQDNVCESKHFRKPNALHQSGGDICA